MTDHPTRVANLKPKQLAQKIAFMRYDALAEFLKELSLQLHSDARDDRERGREMLARVLDMAGHEVIHAHQSIEHAWTICEPKMGKK